MGIGKKMSKGSIGGGVNISHKSKMSQSAKNQMSFPGGMPGPGDYGKIVGKGMAQYMAGEAVGMKKHGKHKGPAQAKPDYIDIDGDGNKTESMKQAADGMGRYDHKSKGAAKKIVKSVKEIGRAKLSSEAEGEMINSNFVSNDPKGKTLNTTIKPKSKRKPSKEIGKSKIEEGKKLKKEGRQEKRAARKDARKSKRSARLDKKIALQEFKGKQAGDGKEKGINSKALRKRKRVAKLKARKAKK